MENLVNSLKSVALAVGEKFVPVLRESKFRETGVLTPDEFVAAGDHLVHHCPTWRWAKAADKRQERDYLPPEKQFLLTRQVPCHKRCAQMAYDPQLEFIIRDDETHEEWVDTHFYSNDATANVVQTIPDDVPASSTNARTAAFKSADNHADNDDDDDDNAPPIDMDDFAAGGNFNEADDPNCFKPPPTASTAVDDGGNDNIVRTRTYDLHITYDKYYQVPRLWLVGYNEAGGALTVEQMYEDFSADHANKTITIESHPHMPMQIASIHPCRHADVMKRLIEQYAESGRQLDSEQYLLIFLKFVQAIIPTIEYDFTQSIQL